MHAFPIGPAIHGQSRRTYGFEHGEHAVRPTAVPWLDRFDLSDPQGC